nr:hypothetical protein [Stenotrophomonas geniculata]
MFYEKFWVVWNPKTRSVNVRHYDIELATLEAERLAERNPGESFVVLEAISESKKVSVTTRLLRTPEDEIPF